MVKYFVEELDEHILKRICPTDVCEFKAKTI